MVWPLPYEKKAPKSANVAVEQSSVAPPAAPPSSTNVPPAAVPTPPVSEIPPAA